MPSAALPIAAADLDEIESRAPTGARKAEKTVVKVMLGVFGSPQVKMRSPGTRVTSQGYSWTLVRNNLHQIS
jgi:hypothetical protein